MIYKVWVSARFYNKMLKRNGCGIGINGLTVHTKHTRLFIKGAN